MAKFLSINMRTKLLLILTLISMIKCTPKPESINLTDFKSIEGVRIGMPINSAVELISEKYFVEKTTVSNYEEEEVHYIVYSDKKKRTELFSFNGGYDDKNNDKVFRIVIKDPRYIAPDGVKVGMTVDELKRLTRLKSADFNYDDGLFIISDVFDGGFSLNYTTDMDYKDFDYENPKINSIPGDIKIKEIMIF